MEAAGLGFCDPASTYEHLFLSRGAPTHERAREPFSPRLSTPWYRRFVRLIRLLRWLIGAYVLVAVLNRVAEVLGLQRCGCAPGCCCKRPVLGIFRWVFPYRHRGYSPHEKELRAPSH